MLIRLAFTLTLFLAVPQDRETVRQSEAHFDRGVAAAYVLGTAYLQNEQIAEGRVLIDKVFAQLPAAEGHLILGAFNAASRKHTAAIEEFKAAIKNNPKLPTVHSQLGVSYLISGNRDLAIAEFRNELTHNSRDFIANIRLGWLLREDGLLDEAEPLLKRALELHPDDIAALFQTAQLQQARGRTAEAVPLLERAVALKPDYRQAYVLLARLYLKQKRTGDANRIRAIIDKLNDEEQQRQPSADKLTNAPAKEKPQP